MIFSTSAEEKNTKAFFKRYLSLNFKSVQQRIIKTSSTQKINDTTLKFYQQVLQKISYILQLIVE